MLTCFFYTNNLNKTQLTLHLNNFEIGTVTVECIDRKGKSPYYTQSGVDTLIQYTVTQESLRTNLYFPILSI